MCAGCLTAVDTYVMAAVAAGAVVEAGCARMRALFDSEFASQRLVKTWQRNAEFCQHMGLDPVTVLGAMPAALPVRPPIISLPSFAPAQLAWS